MKNFRTPIILFFALGVLATIAYWDDWQTAKDQKAEESKDRIFDFAVDKVRELQFVNRELNVDLAAKLDEQSGRWVLSRPIEGLADSAAIENLIKTIAEYKMQKVVSESKDKWSIYGVETPEREVRLLEADGTPHSLFVGNEAPVGYAVYFRTGDSDKVYIGSQYLLTATAKKFKEFRSKDIVELDPETVSDVSYTSGGQTVMTASRGEDGNFSFVEPEGIKADHEEILDFVAELPKIKAEDFKDQPDDEFLSNYAGAANVIEVAWTTKQGSQQALRVATIGDKFWAKTGSGNFVSISSNDMKKLNKQLIDFRDRSLFSFQADQVSAITVDGKSYIKKDGDFYSKDDPKEKFLHVQNLVSDLVWAKAKAFPATRDLKDVLSRAPLHKISITLAGSDKPLVVEFWDQEDGILLRRDGDVILGPLNLLENIAPTESSFPASELDELPDDVDAAAGEDEPDKG